MTDETEPLIFAGVTAWRTWLSTHESVSDGTWLLLAKNCTTSPTSLTYAQALEEALCSGWIDGQRARVDAVTFRQRFTPRRKNSTWSQRNVEIVERLTAEKRIRPRGQAEIDRAEADGRWARAYAGAATASVPDDLAAALGTSRAAAAGFASLNRTSRYRVLHQVLAAPSDASREKRIAKLVRTLERGGTC